MSLEREREIRGSHLENSVTYSENTPAVFSTAKSRSTNHRTFSDPKFF